VCLPFAVDMMRSAAPIAAQADRPLRVVFAIKSARLYLRSGLPSDALTATDIGLVLCDQEERPALLMLRSRCLLALHAPDATVRASLQATVDAARTLTVGASARLLAQAQYLLAVYLMAEGAAGRAAMLLRHSLQLVRVDDRDRLTLLRLAAEAVSYGDVGDVDAEGLWLELLRVVRALGTGADGEVLVRLGLARALGAADPAPLDTCALLQEGLRYGLSCVLPVRHH
jgi:hypothetical protein